MELCLSAYLRQKGMTGHEVRGMQHKLVERAGHAKEKGLVLRHRTIAHLAKLELEREHLMTRYQPAPACLPIPAQITATLKDLFDKAGKAFN